MESGRNMLASLAAAAFLASSAATALNIDPYYAFNWTEGFTMPSVGDWFIGSNFASSVGGQFKFNESQSALGMYSIKYTGPGLKTQEGREFSERTLDNNILVEDRWTVLPGYTVRTRALYMNQMRRTGSNEVWGRGLYDFWTTGGGVAQDFMAPFEIGATVDVSYQYFGFPNYTDLLKEFQTGGISAEQSGGQQDFNNVRFRAEGRWAKIATSWVGWNLQSYVNAKVVESTGEYGGKNQLDNTIELGTDAVLALLPPGEGGEGALNLNPSLKVDFKRSNQNFLRFATFGTTTPDFIADYYDYNSVELGVPLRWVFSANEDGGTSILYLSLNWLFTAYSARPPRDAAGDYEKSKQQWTSIFQVTPGIALPLNRFTRWNLGYTFHVASSNNKFEKFLPYNYQGHTFYSSVDIAY